MLAPRALQVVEKTFHGLKTGGVERLEDVEGGEEEGAGAAGGVEHGDGFSRAFQKARTSSGPSLLAITS